LRMAVKVSQRHGWFVGIITKYLKFHITAQWHRNSNNLIL
jgi:hypothetical protein